MKIEKQLKSVSYENSFPVFYCQWKNQLMTITQTFAAVFFFLFGIFLSLLYNLAAS